MVMPRSARPPLIALLVLGYAVWPGRASAHISLEQGGTHQSRYGDATLKDPPCGLAGGQRGTNIYTYAPGETIEVSLVEYIPHPSYFRIAFDSDGDDDFEDPVSIRPIDPARPCPFNQFDQCGATDAFNDFYNTPAVLPGLDDLNPHISASIGQKYTWEVTLPNIQCDNCTLQVIQVMQDTIHGAYNTDPSIEPGYVEDVYHQCIDLILEGPLQPAPDAGAPGAGGAGAPSGTDDAGSTAGTGGTGGAGGTASTGGPSGNAGASNMGGAPSTGGAFGAGGTSQAGGATGGGPSGSGGSAGAPGAGTAGAGALPSTADDSGCSCRLGRGQHEPPFGSALSALAVAWVRRRRGSRGRGMSRHAHRGR